MSAGEGGSDGEKKTSSMAGLSHQWKSLEQEMVNLEEAHFEYLAKLKEVCHMQQSCLKNVQKFQKQLGGLRNAIKSVEHEGEGLTQGEKEQLGDLEVEVGDCRTRLFDMTEELPRQGNGLYLNIILGSSLNVSLMNKDDKFRYKDEYEKFKATVTMVSLVFACLAWLVDNRVADAMFHFLLVWYYCTLTIRESILRINGSRIKGWWVFHHYASTVLCGILVTCPDDVCYRDFRKLFLLFSIYISAVQLMQCQYQRGVLYRLKSLGQRHSMDITVEGFHSWMFKGLTFLLPSLIVGYMFQLYCAFSLLKIWYARDCKEWQMPMVAFLFFLLAVGNTLTTARVIIKKLQERGKPTVRHRLETKYSVSGGLSPNEPGKKND